MSENKTVIVWAGLRIKEDFVSEFKKAAQVVVDSTRKEEGCLKYDLLQDVSDSCSFYFFEEYKDESAFATHRTMPYMDTFRKLRAEFVDKYYGVRTMEEISSR